MTSKDIFDCISGRRSIRKFKTTEVSDELVEKLLEAARLAPSAGNVQDWHFVVVRDREIKGELAEAARQQFFIASAPVVVVYFANIRKIEQAYGKRGKELYAFQDSGAAIQNLLLAAYALELGTCWVGAFNEEKVNALLKAPKGFRAIAIIPIGYPNERPPMRKRRDLSVIVSYDQFML